MTDFLAGHVNGRQVTAANRWLALSGGSVRRAVQSPRWKSDLMFEIRQVTPRGSELPTVSLCNGVVRLNWCDAWAQCGYGLHD